MYLFVEDGPYISSGTKLNPKAIITIFKYKELRLSAWILWSYVGALYVLGAHSNYTSLLFKIKPCEIEYLFLVFHNNSLRKCWLFCWRIAFKENRKCKSSIYSTCPLITCCLISPLMFYTSAPIFLTFLVFWGIVVVGDSPQYSAIIALEAPKELVGSGLTLVNSIGFAITILSLWFVYQFLDIINISYALMRLFRTNVRIKSL